MATKNDPGIAGRQRKREVKKAAENAAGLSIAERLTRRAKAESAILTLPPDDDGEITLEMHLPTWNDTCELTQIDVMMTSKPGRKQLAKILFDLCMTDDLDLAFWESGAIGLVDMRLIVEGLLAAAGEAIKAAERVQTAQSFRSD